MCLTNPSTSFLTTPTLAACNPSDPAQAFQTSPQTTIATSFLTASPQFLTFEDEGLVAKLIGAFQLAGGLV
jgi:hypothetical protein